MRRAMMIVAVLFGMVAGGVWSWGAVSAPTTDLTLNFGPIIGELTFEAANYVQRGGTYGAISSNFSEDGMTWAEIGFYNPENVLGSSYVSVYGYDGTATVWTTGIWGGGTMGNWSYDGVLSNELPGHAGDNLLVVASTSVPEPAISFFFIVASLLGLIRRPGLSASLQRRA